jgi:tricorn protease
MKHFCRSLLLMAFAFSPAVAVAQEPIRFARLPDISPDGKVVAFSYLGDVWTVEAIGGVARPVTMHQAHDTNPVFSPDGRFIAFSSNRHGSYDVFVVPAQGGKPRCLTHDSAADMVCGWSPDGKSILFASTRSTDFPSGYELYTVSVEGGRAHKITSGEGREGVISPRGDQVAYVRGPGTWYRKGYRGSSNDDVWVCNLDGPNNRRLTTFNGQDNSPMWSNDGQTIYYVSEIHGTPANIVKQDAAGQSPPVLVTHHTDEAVRRARISGNGEWLVYECGADLWIASTKSAASPRKLAIEVNADDKTNTEATVTLTKGATEYAIAPDERHVAFSVHGEIFLMPMQANAKATRLTESPAYDHGMAWAPDGNKLLFTSDRKVTQLTNTTDAELGAGFAPDGKHITFIRAGKLWTMNVDGSDAKVLVNDPSVIDYEWSPDGKWIAFAREDGSFASEIYIMPAAGGEAKNVTHYATRNTGITCPMPRRPPKSTGTTSTCVSRPPPQSRPARAPFRPTPRRARWPSVRWGPVAMTCGWPASAAARSCG